MKKLLSILVIAGMASLVACGPSAEEIAAKEKAKQDSIAAVQKAKEDSIAAASAKKGTKPTTTTTKPATDDKTKVKAGQGKG